MGSLKYVKLWFLPFPNYTNTKVIYACKYIIEHIILEGPVGWGPTSYCVKLHLSGFLKKPSRTQKILIFDSLP